MISKELFKKLLIVKEFTIKSLRNLKLDIQISQGLVLEKELV
jgi:hypothetical protein